MSKVTICIPAYNAEKTIAETLESLLNQTYGDFNIIVSDNYSTDRTVEVVKEYEHRGVKLVTCPLQPINTGSLLDNSYSSGQNWNSLIDIGDTDFIGIFHSDDIFSIDLIQKQVEIIEANEDCCIVFSMLKYIDENSRIINVKIDNLGDTNFIILNQLDFINNILEKNHFFSTSGVLIKRDKWKQAGKFDPYKWEQQADTEFWIRISEFGRVAIINEQLVLYRLHLNQDSNKWKQIYKFKQIPFFDVIDHYLYEKDFINKINKKSKSKYQLYKNKDSIRLAANYCNNNQNEESLLHLNSLPSLFSREIFQIYILAGKKFLVKLIISKLMIFAIKFKFNLILKINLYLIKKIE
jgi:glycosyltransferase involved in cell wall biosynthesis